MKKFCLMLTTLLFWIVHPTSLAATLSGKASSKHAKHATALTKPSKPVAHKASKTTQPAGKSKTHKSSHTKIAAPAHHHNSPQVNLSDASDSDAADDSDTQAPMLSAPARANSMRLAQTNDAPEHHFLWFSWGGNNRPDNIDRWHPATTGVTHLANQTVAHLHYSAYKFGGNRFDPAHGIYLLDCSAYVDNLLNQTSPRAYSTLAQWTGTYRPNTAQYYDFFSSLTNHGGLANWNPIGNSQKLRPGDILVFRYKGHGHSGGHVMLVMDKSVVKPDVVQVKVADSAQAGHSGDTRGGHSGIGIGTLLLKVNPATGQPYAFAWREDAPWNSRVNIAMARPVDA